MIRLLNFAEHFRKRLFGVLLQMVIEKSEWIMADVAACIAPFGQF
jgi:hypothetical protein